MANFLVLHGPNLNLLGTREPDIYGGSTLDQINSHLKDAGDRAGHDVKCFQSNAEHELVEEIQRASADGIEMIVINPGAFTHTSVALRDALLAVGIPFIEVHLSNVYAREEFRQLSYFSDIAKGVISGLGADGYSYALDVAFKMVSE
tara:strand:- start:19 stop:459 length:441 start_codon:yes stop_codon:yes gene_type:complete